ncbi:MAG: AraC family transcriptional regulator [Nonlabens sp.]
MNFLTDFPFSYGQKSSLLLIFFFHGIVFMVLSLYHGFRNNLSSSKWLSFLLFLGTLYITPYMLGYAGWYGDRNTREILFFIPFMQVFLIGPVVYFYLKSLLDNRFKIGKKEFVHFIPSIAYLFYSLVIFVTDKLILEEFYFYADGRDKDLANCYQVTGLLSMAFYLMLSLRVYFAYRKMVFETTSYAESILYRWIRNFIIAFLSLLLLRVLLFILNPDWGEFGNQFWYYLCFAMVIFYISLNGYSHIVKQSILQNYLIAQTHDEEDETRKVDAPEIQPAANIPNIEEWKFNLDKVIQEHLLYQNPKLTLAQVAEKMDSTPKMISTIVNSGHGMNFNDYINRFRVDAVKQLIKSGRLESLTLLAIALESGFNSKATFNRAFKKHDGMTPKNYVDSIK